MFKNFLFFFFANEKIHFYKLYKNGGGDGDFKKFSQNQSHTIDAYSRAKNRKQ